MIIVCQKCSTRLQIDDEKSPQRPFNVRCPKCNSTVSSGPANPATEQSALAVGGSPATDHPRFEPVDSARLSSRDASVTAETAASNDDAVRMLDGPACRRALRSNTDNPTCAPVVGQAQGAGLHE